MLENMEKKKRLEEERDKQFKRTTQQRDNKVNMNRERERESEKTNKGTEIGQERADGNKEKTIQEQQRQNKNVKDNKDEKAMQKQITTTIKKEPKGKVEEQKQKQKQEQQGSMEERCGTNKGNTTIKELLEKMGTKGLEQRKSKDNRIKHTSNKKIQQYNNMDKNKEINKDEIGCNNREIDNDSGDEEQRLRLDSKDGRDSTEQGDYRQGPSRARVEQEQGNFCLNKIDDFPGVRSRVKTPDTPTLHNPSTHTQLEQPAYRGVEKNRGRK